MLHIFTYCILYIVILTPWSRLLEKLIFTPWNRLQEKLTGSQPVKKFLAFYGTRRFITAFTRACHLPLP